jgi:predicted esterase
MRRLFYSLLLLSLALGNSALRAGEDVLLMSGGQSIRVLYFEPATGDTDTPLAVMVTGGSSNEFMARAQFWLGKELVDRGWAVAVPISPDGRDFFVEHAAEFPQLISDLRNLHDLNSSKTLLVGISSGGSAALKIAAMKPDQYLGVVATPGRLKGDDLQYLDGLPVFLRIGEKDDLRWNRRMDRDVARLQSAGAVVNAALVPGAKHIFPVNWTDLEAWLETTLQGL